MKAAMVLLALSIALSGVALLAPSADASRCVIGESSDCIIQVYCLENCCTGPCCYPYDCAEP